jgi:NhaP-type Na+/H+ or K+/H+ antiporter
MARGYAIAFVSFFIALRRIAVAALFFRRARVMDAILNSNQLLAHWVYHPEMARDRAQREYREFLERNRAMFILIGGMLGVVSLVFIIFIEDEGLFNGTFLLVFTVVLFIIARITPKLELNRALKAPHEAYIARNGIICEGQSILSSRL